MATEDAGQFDIDDAQASLSRIIDLVELGEEIIAAWPAGRGTRLGLRRGERSDSPRLRLSVTALAHGPFRGLPPATG